MKIKNLKPGDSIKNLNPYPGEGEYMIAEVNQEEREFKVICCLSTKHPALNGVATHLSFDVVESSYKKVDTSKSDTETTWTPKPGGVSSGKEDQYIIPTPGSLIDGKLKDIISEHFSGDDKQCKCTHRGIVHYRERTLVCMQCGGIVGELGDIAFINPCNPKWDNTSPPIIKFDVLAGDAPSGNEDLALDDLEKTEKAIARRKSILAIQQLIERVKNFGDDADGQPFWKCDNWEWVFTTGRLEWFVELDLKSWQVLPHLGLDFRDEQFGFGWLFFNVTIDYSKDLCKKQFRE